MALPIVAAEFWVATEPELRFQPGSGDAVLNFRAKAQDRNYNKDTKEFENGKSLWVRVTCWRKLAENVADSIIKGDNVVLTGKLSTREYEGKDGVKREVLELEATEVGASLRFRTTPHGAGGGGKQAASNTREPVSTGGGGSAPEKGTGDADGEPVW